MAVAEFLITIHQNSKRRRKKLSFHGHCKGKFSSQGAHPLLECRGGLQKSPNYNASYTYVLILEIAQPSFLNLSLHERKMCIGQIFFQSHQTVSDQDGAKFNISSSVRSTVQSFHNTSNETIYAFALSSSEFILHVICYSVYTSHHTFILSFEERV